MHVDKSQTVHQILQYSRTFHFSTGLFQYRSVKILQTARLASLLTAHAEGCVGFICHKFGNGKRIGLKQ